MFLLCPKFLPHLPHLPHRLFLMNLPLLPHRLFLMNLPHLFVHLNHLSRLSHLHH
jgi:hypothetical protein